MLVLQKAFKQIKKRSSEYFLSSFLCLPVKTTNDRVGLFLKKRSTAFGFNMLWNHTLKKIYDSNAKCRNSTIGH
jgi:hypothetical protein